jgi:hypothetical protein
LILFCSCEQQHNIPRKKITTCYAIKSKETRLQSYGRGYFEEEYFLLYENGTLKQVSFETYMRFNEKDTICWSEIAY